jgi:hypothetical protein
MGRPSTFDPQIANQICEMLASGLSLRAICQEPQMPPEATVRSWVVYDYQGFAAQYTHARTIGLDCLADRVIELAENPVVAVKHVQKADGGIEITTGDAVDRSRLAVDTLKWYLCKLAPKRYGERLELAGDKGAPLTITVVREDVP